MVKSRLTKTCVNLILGIAIFVAIIGVIGVIIALIGSKNWLSFLLGDLLGGFGACVLAIDMDRCIQKAVDMNPERAEKYIKKTAFFRFIMMAIILLIALTFPTVFHLAGVLFGLFALKFSAYWQTITSKK